MTIVLIEDEPLLSSMYTAILSQAGYEVVPAMDAATGQAKVVSLQPGVVLLDLLIPVSAAAHGSTSGESMHEPMGFEILRLVKKTPSLADTRVIILSNLDSDEHVQTARSLGADGYLIKANLDPHTLPEQVVEALKKTTPR
jgi:two-component system chemotaxis response regulator CheY